MTLSKNTFTGEYSYSVDAKGRVNIPAKFRQVLSKDNNNTFVITRGQDTCIWVYPLTVWQQIETELKQLSALSAINRTFIRNTVRHASFTTYDKQGRILLTPSLIDYAGLSKDVLIIGMVNKIELWNPETLVKVDQENMKIEQHSYDDLADKIIL
ncbi:MAG: division/cell wall cluster transcriptional repressor MraZ [Candidatus Marinimicrobia bacterium]|nr:division/cell wall cluster transcriptional repressor MraZ [Candidatus Neomarinimicrobiota bacterium]MBL7059374.1 division/cell wall cluster transcriptional repressor MraZ [Candidatus Neomarinimicrobiota bacterium]